MALTPREIEFKNKLYNQYKKNKSKFIKDYGENAEQVMLGRSIKLAKQMASNTDKKRIKEMIKKTLMNPIEEINSANFIQNQKPVTQAPVLPIKNDKEKNPIDVIMMDVPLMIRLLEYAREDAKEDVDLHNVAENLIELSKKGKVLDMSYYYSIISPDEKID